MNNFLAKKKRHAVAIIDIDLDKETHCKYLGLTVHLMVDSKDVTRLDVTALVEYTSHGSQCLMYFETASKATADYFILLEKDEDDRCKVNDLVVALDWCIENSVSLISLSMGTTQYSDASKLSNVMKRIDEAGICLISGASNERHLSYPACLNDAIGVCVDYANEMVKDRFVYIDDAYDGIDVVLNPKVLENDFIHSNSMATAYFSGMVARAMNSEEVEPCNVRKWIIDNAGRIPNDLIYGYTLNAIVFEATEDIVIIGIDGLSSGEHVIDFCRGLQDIFLRDEYHCLAILPNSGLDEKGYSKSNKSIGFSGLGVSDFVRHEFVQPKSTRCSYTDYIKLIKKLCKPNVILVDFENTTIDYDVVIMNEMKTKRYGGTFIVPYGNNAPSDVFKQIVEYFDDKS